VAVGLLGGALLGGCASGSPPRAWNEPETTLVWPAPPEQARVQYLGSIRTAANLGVTPGFFERLRRLVLGTRELALVKPVAVARNARGLLVVADPGVPTVHFFDLEQKKHRWLSREWAEKLRSPVGVAVDDADRVYVADSVLARVLVFGPEGEPVAEIGEGVFQRPTGLALGPRQKRLYVVDTLACRVLVFDRDGREIARFGRRGVGPGELNFPTHVTVSRDGTIAVSDSLNFRVQLFRSDGTPLGSFGRAGDGAGDFARPKGIGADTAGRLYVVDAAFENVQIFDREGRILLAFGSAGGGPGELYLPSGLHLDSRNTIWVADSFNGRVQVFRLLPEAGP
jgi:sugar lactone lactonase YvrE